MSSLRYPETFDSSYRLRQGPSVISRKINSTDLILSKVDRLAQMAEIHSTPYYAEGETPTESPIINSPKTKPVMGKQNLPDCSKSSSIQSLQDSVALPSLEPSRTQESILSSGSYSGPNTQAVNTPVDAFFGSKASHIRSNSVLSEEIQNTPTISDPPPPSTLPKSSPFQLELSLTSSNLSSLIFSEFSQLSFEAKARAHKSKNMTSRAKSPLETIGSVIKNKSSTSIESVKDIAGLAPSLSATPIQHESPLINEHDHSEKGRRELHSFDTTEVSKLAISSGNISNSDVTSERLQTRRMEINQEKALISSLAARKAHNKKNEKDGNPVIVDGPNVGSPVISLTSFDSIAGIGDQFCSCIPSPILNAISFTPPIGSVPFTPPIGGAIMVSSSDDDNGLSDMDSIFSNGTFQSQPKENPDAGNEPANSEEELVAADRSDTNQHQGRLFVRVDGLSDLKLPINPRRNPKFTMTLDNGRQTVTTDPINVASDAAEIGQEFELLVDRDLTQLTFSFQAQMNPLPKTEMVSKLSSTQGLSEVNRVSNNVRRSSSVKSTITAQSITSHRKHTRFRSMFSASPKKKTIGTLKGKSSSPIPAIKQKRQQAPTPKPRDIWDGILGPHGEFGRCHLQTTEYKEQVFGEPKSFTLSVFNEWEHKELTSSTELNIPLPNFRNNIESSVSLPNVPSHAQSTRGPVKIANIQMTLMYIPTVPKMTNTPLPTSIKTAVSEFAQIQASRSISLNGYLSQEGGDCNYWRRRWFELRGGTLIGHTEDTKKVRAVLHLINAESVTEIDSEMSDVSINSDLSFCMKFNDGEVISFYADNAAQKTQWVQTLNNAIENCTGKSYTWVDEVLEHRRREKEGS